MLQSTYILVVHDQLFDENSKRRRTDMAQILATGEVLARN